MAKGNRGGKRAKASLNVDWNVPNGYSPLSNAVGDTISDYWYGGLNARRTSNKYITMDRVSDDESRIVVKVADEHLISTRYGYGLVLDDRHVVWLKNENVSQNYYGNEVVLNKQYFNVKTWGDFSDRFSSEPKNLKFDEWLKTAKAQQKAGNDVEWEMHYHSPKTRAVLKNMSK